MLCAPTHLDAHGKVAHLEVRVGQPEQVGLRPVDEAQPQHKPAGPEEQNEGDRQLRDGVDLAVESQC